MKSLRIMSLGAAGVLLLYAGTAIAAKPAPIFQCETEITVPGKYFLTQDLFCLPDQQGIVVLSSDVTVDLKGHTITCDAENTGFLVGAVLVGDYFDPDLVLENVTVKNGTVSGCDDGVVYFYTQGGKITDITAQGNPVRGITLVATNGLVVKNSNASGNAWGIYLFAGADNTIKHNTTHDNYESGIFLYGESGSKVACNKSAGNLFGIGIAPFSSGNEVKGNFVENSVVVGINGWGYIYGDYYEPVPWDNVIKKNLVRTSGFYDLDEVVFDDMAGQPYVDEELGCQNTWKKNDYVTALGPTDCFAPPVELDDDDVCALDDDDDSDSDSDSD